MGPRTHRGFFQSVVPFTEATAIGVIVHFIVTLRTLTLGMGVCNNWSGRVKLSALAL